MNLDLTKFRFMKMNYYVSLDPQDNGDHEVHSQACRVLPKPEERLFLGEFYTCQDALRAARKVYLTSDGCRICSPGCHSR